MDDCRKRQTFAASPAEPGDLLGRLGHIAGEPHATLRYQCSPHHLNSPFYPVISQLEHAMGLEQADTPSLKFEKLEASLSQAVEPTEEDILLYAALLSIATPERELSPDLTPRRQKDLTIAALSRHLLTLLWQIYSRRCLLQIHFWQCGQRCFGGWAISSRMACRTAGKVG